MSPPSQYANGAGNLGPLIVIVTVGCQPVATVSQSISKEASTPIAARISQGAHQPIPGELVHDELAMRQPEDGHRIEGRRLVFRCPRPSDSLVGP